jgi:7-cyano-7-deazaguanine reductase
MTDELTVLGHDVREPTRRLECFEAPDTVTWVTFASDEVTTMCPITGQPDFSRVEIGYRPAGRCLESKSLKLYLWSFRDEGIFCEGLAARIAEDVAAATGSPEVDVVVRQGVRGGIVTTARAEVRR